jgi:hypothetical protein
MTFGRGPHQRILPFARFGGVHLGAFREQELHRAGVAGSRGEHKGCFAIPARGSCVSSGFQQSGDDGSVAVRTGQCQRRVAIFVRGVHFGAGFHQQVHRFCLVQINCPGQRRGSVRLRHIDVDVFAEERIYGFIVAILDGFDQAQIAGGSDGDEKKTDH